MDQKNHAYLTKEITRRKIERLLGESARNSPWSRSTLAKLRRGIGKHPGELPELFEIILGDVPEELYGKGNEPSYSVWAIHTALTLFALHQQGQDRPMSVSIKKENETKGNSLGAAVGFLAAGSSVRKEREREIAIKRRFDAVITANAFTELAHHARGLIQLLKAGDITLDYPSFAEDLFRYQFDEGRNRIRLRWGEDYYRVVAQSIEKENGGDSNDQ